MENIKLPADPLSRASIAHVQHWIDTCISDHEDCKFSSDTKLPTRVLDLQDLNSAKVYCLNGERGRYYFEALLWNFEMFHYNTIHT